MMGEHTARCEMCRSNFAIEERKKKKHLCRLSTVDSVRTFSAFGYIVYVCESKADLPTIICESKEFAQKQNPINKYESMIGFNAPANTRVVRVRRFFIVEKKIRLSFTPEICFLQFEFSVSQFGVPLVSRPLNCDFSECRPLISQRFCLSLSLSLYPFTTNPIHFFFR